LPPRRGLVPMKEQFWARPIMTGQRGFLRCSRGGLTSSVLANLANRQTLDQSSQE
jgi:hypothetical protein